MIRRPDGIEAGAAGLSRWLAAFEPGQVDAWLESCGAMILRGFGIDSQAAFVATLDELGVSRTAYVAGNSPRSTLGGGVFTSTEYPAKQEISLHNELSYSEPWPQRLYLCCLEPAQTGGATTVGDGHRVLSSLSTETAEAFQRRRVRYVRNLHGGRGIGRSWQATFATDDRAAVERACRASNTALTWTSDGARLVHTGPGIVRHPRTGVLVWFNQAEQFHPSSLPAAVADFLLDEYRGREEELPQWASFADGGHIPAAMLREIRQSLRAATTSTPWERGDVMIVDNVRALHGREPFTGPRRILLAMS